jgi:hypothetical protein
MLYIGTDTPQAEILVNADAPIEEGEFELSIEYYGERKIQDVFHGIQMH